MGRQAPAGWLGIHTNLPAALPPEIGAALAGGGPAPAGLSEQERASFEILRTSGMNRNLAYVTMMGARPQAVGYGLTDSPAGLAALSSTLSSTLMVIDLHSRTIPTPARGAAATCVTKRSMYDDNNAGGADQSTWWRVGSGRACDA